MFCKFPCFLKDSGNETEVNIHFPPYLKRIALCWIVVFHVNKLNISPEAKLRVQSCLKYCFNF